MRRSFAALAQTYLAPSACGKTIPMQESLYSVCFRSLHAGRGFIAILLLTSSWGCAMVPTFTFRRQPASDLDDIALLFLYSVDARIDGRSTDDNGDSIPGQKAIVVQLDPGIYSVAYTAPQCRGLIWGRPTGRILEGQQRVVVRQGWSVSIGVEMTGHAGNDICTFYSREHPTRDLCQLAADSWECRYLQGASRGGGAGLRTNSKAVSTAQVYSGIPKPKLTIASLFDRAFERGIFVVAIDQVRHASDGRLLANEQYFEFLPGQQVIVIKYGESFHSIAFDALEGGRYVLSWESSGFVLTDSDTGSPVHFSRVAGVNPP